MAHVMPSAAVIEEAKGAFDGAAREVYGREASILNPSCLLLRGR